MTKVEPGFSRLPPPVPLAMSQTEQTETPTPSPIPPRVPPKPGQEQPKSDPTTAFGTSPRLEPCRPLPKHWPQPRLRFRCDNVSHKAADILFENNNPSRLLQSAIDIVLSTLYKPNCETSDIPPVKSITLVMREMDGVAYTTGNNELGDENHKEIHFNLNHITNVGPNKARMVSEIRGVFVHEMVHCWQWNGLGHAPTGLIEGFADWVRLRSGFSPPHWKREADGKWDAGYQHTAYFLDWLDTKYGEGKIVTLNGSLQYKKYEENLWEKLFGQKVESLFEEYQKALKSE